MHSTGYPCRTMVSDRRMKRTSLGPQLAALIPSAFLILIVLAFGACQKQPAISGNTTPVNVAAMPSPEVSATDAAPVVIGTDSHSPSPSASP